MRVTIRVRGGPEGLMSFLGKMAGGAFKVGKGALRALRNPTVRTLVSGAFPAAAPAYAALDRIMNAATQIEAAHAAEGREKSGPEKHQFVIEDFEQGLAMYRAVARLRGKDLVYDEQARDQLIEHQVAAMNLAQKLVASIQERDLAEP